MSEHFAQKRSEAMPIDFMIDKTPTESAQGATVSRESSFSSVELAASNSLSRESSFSSAASSSGSGIFEADSPRPPSRSSSWRSNEDSSERQLISSVTDQQYQRLHNARARFRKARDAPSSGSSSTEVFHTPPENARTMTNLDSKRPEVHGRSASEPEVLSKISKSKLSSSPAGLVITAPPVKGFIEYRLRSRSFTGEDNTEEDRILKDFSQSLLLQVPDNGMESIKRSSPVSRRKETKEKMDKNLRTSSFSEKDYELLKKERDDLQQERNNLRHECDRLQCERDAMQLERDTLIREKEELQAELNNRNDVIHHLQDHVGMSVRSLAVTDETKSSTMKQRSKSEVRRPAFYFPDELAKTNAYTCL